LKEKVRERERKSQRDIRERERWTELHKGEMSERKREKARQGDRETETHKER
jgi:hypothetical protein